jgi:hypothetical protein
MQGSSTDRPRLTAWELYKQQAQRVDDRQVLLDRREQFSDETRGGAMALSDELAAAAARAQPIYEEFGSSAPSTMQGEDARSYKIHVCSELKKHSAKHSELPLRALENMQEAAFENVVSEILADAYEVAKAYAPPGQLRQRTEVRQDGSTHITWAGDMRIWLNRFMAPARAVTRLRIRGVDVVPNRSFIKIE